MSQTAVDRLKDTWKEVSPKMVKAFQEMQAMFQPLNSWKIARDLLHRCQPPAIPYIGASIISETYVSELTRPP